MNISSKLSVKKTEEILKTAIGLEEPVILTTCTFSHETELYTEKLLTLFFKQLKQEGIKDYVIYCVKELMGNAKKANTKRIYFREKGLDITDEEDYRKGMATFKEDTFNNIKYYLKSQKEKGLYVKLAVQIKEEMLCIIEVRNNVEMTKTELSRMENKLRLAKRFNSMEEVMTEVLDDSEGSGLGLIILILMMKKMGLDKENFTIKGAEGETVVRMTIPLGNGEPEELEELEEE
jgi:glutamyl/glutaminyl-tRNA synthetase